MAEGAGGRGETSQGAQRVGIQKSTGIFGGEQHRFDRRRHRPVFFTARNRSGSSREEK